MQAKNVTLYVTPTGITPAVGREGKLWYQAPGLDIYVVGHVRIGLRPQVHFAALEQGIAMRIPAIELRHVDRRSGAKKPASKNQLRLFD